MNFVYIYYFQTGFILRLLLAEPLAIEKFVEEIPGWITKTTVIPEELAGLGRVVEKVFLFPFAWILFICEYWSEHSEYSFLEFSIQILLKIFCREQIPPMHCRRNLGSNSSQQISEFRRPVNEFPCTTSRSLRKQKKWNIMEGKRCRVTSSGFS